MGVGSLYVGRFPIHGIGSLYMGIGSLYMGIGSLHLGVGSL